jgi:hypothetical protein|nr:MAG TPA: hypothetical protein [Caudoviricetes sp.]
MANTSISLKDVTSIIENIGKIANVVTKFTGVNNNYNKNESTLSKEEIELFNTLDDQDRLTKIKAYLENRIDYIKKNNEAIESESKSRTDPTSVAFWTGVLRDIGTTIVTAGIGLGAAYIYKKYLKDA